MLWHPWHSDWVSSSRLVAEPYFTLFLTRAGQTPVSCLRFASRPRPLLRDSYFSVYERVSSGHVCRSLRKNPFKTPGGPRWLGGLQRSL